MPISAPTRTTTQSVLPQGWGFLKRMTSSRRISGSIVIASPEAAPIIPPGQDGIIAWLCLDSHCPTC
jgi:hypothetical protein